MKLSSLSRFPKTNLSILPTPLMKLENLSKKYNANIYCKRDDLTGFAFGGNKTRKLDYLIADAKNKNADTLIGVGAIQSNFCRITAGAGVVCGFDVHLVLGGKKPEKPSANYLIDEMLGAKIHFVESDNWDDWENYGKNLADELTKKGKNVYYMPIGGSSPIGALGYVNAFFEILDDCKKQNLKLDYIVHSSTSAGTQSGLIIGKKLSGWHGKILGFGSAKNQKQLSEEINTLANETGKFFEVSVGYDEIIIDDKYIGGDYGVVTEKGKEAVEIFARLEGIFLDYVYSGKAASGLLDYIEKNKFDKNSNILFIHTGGNVHLFKN